ncbi:MAG: hypothetical protein A4E42_01298 [Methanoregulaceae archaeon PtaU1.Bin222]|nr:MAG: hypothetical protein A4E42_01298 [Methanoregulaceae archaeon PtaU1.Bin222]
MQSRLRELKVQDITDQYNTVGYISPVIEVPYLQYSLG